MTKERADIDAPDSRSSVGGFTAFAFDASTAAVRMTEQRADIDAPDSRPSVDGSTAFAFGASTSAAVRT